MVSSLFYDNFTGFAMRLDVGRKYKPGKRTNSILQSLDAPDPEDLDPSTTKCLTALKSRLILMQ